MLLGMGRSIWRRVQWLWKQCGRFPWSSHTISLPTNPSFRFQKSSWQDGIWFPRSVNLVRLEVVCYPQDLRYPKIIPFRLQEKKLQHLWIWGFPYLRNSTVSTSYWKLECSRDVSRWWVNKMIWTPKISPFRRHIYILYQTERLKAGAHKNSVWASHWLVALRAFYRQTLSLAYRFFPPWNFRPRQARVLLVYSVIYCSITKPRTNSIIEVGTSHDCFVCGSQVTRYTQSSITSMAILRVIQAHEGSTASRDTASTPAVLVVCHSHKPGIRETEGRSTSVPKGSIVPAICHQK